ncbi:hypothetical protein DERF_006622 [Dermatophagoides farinae]|uniref:Uncharacterized protein n=1 Tax=Dermatophagoides farinae TaxID=6954 RepID=A0A922L286_DERFA|nr:hypothetical protein DERF_006622 [Dermatophagoides farinae]
MSECCFILLICFSHEYCNSFCMSTFATLKIHYSYWPKIVISFQIDRNFSLYIDLRLKLDS